MGDKYKLNKGYITNYLTTLTNEQLVENTLTGFLITLIRKKGNLCSLADILSYTEKKFDTLRKPDGKTYTAKSKKKSIVCALSSNGVFNQVKKESKKVSDVAHLRVDKREGAREIWEVNEEESKKFMLEMSAKFDSQRAKLNLRKRKYTGKDITTHI